VDIDTKTRSKFLSPRFEFTYENLQHEFAVAIQRQYEEEGRQMPDTIVPVNLYEQGKEDFAVLLQKTIDTAVQATERGKENEVNTILFNIFKGERLSALTESAATLEKLQVAFTSLSDLLV
jgi:hypothetical protein